MENPVPDLLYYERVAKMKGLDVEALRSEILDLIKETKSYIGAVQQIIKKYNLEENYEVEEVE